MNAYLKSAIRYIGITVLIAVLLWFSLRGLQVEGQDKSAFLLGAWEKCNKWYLILMAIAVTISHIIRSVRWKMLLSTSNNHVGVFTGFLTITIGYLVNLVVPRGGEISRCYYLYKLEKTSVETSFGTVVIERIVDVLCLLLVVVFSFVVEWSKLIAFIGTLTVDNDGFQNFFPWLVVALVLVIIGWWGIRKLARNRKFLKIWLGFRKGLLSVFRLEQRWTFIGYSILIWGLYFIMSYFTVKAFPETSHLGFGAVLTLFALGSIAMAIPLPGGTGSYHTIVPAGLVALYALPKPEAIAFVFIFHAWQTFIMIITGIFSLSLSYGILAWRKRQKK